MCGSGKIKTICEGLRVTQRSLESREPSAGGLETDRPTPRWRPRRLPAAKMAVRGCARAPGLSAPSLLRAESVTRVAGRRLPVCLGGSASHRSLRAMRLLGCWQVLLWVLGPPAHGLEGIKQSVVLIRATYQNHLSELEVRDGGDHNTDVETVPVGQTVAERSGLLWSEEQPAHPLQVAAVYLSEEEPSHGPMGQDKSAEEANEVLGLDTDDKHMVMLSVIPGEAEERPSSEPSDGTCGAGGEEDSRCKIRESLFSLDSNGVNFPDREEEYYTEPEVAEPDLAPTEVSNNTDSLKSPKVNCEERNVTGLENLTLKILNMSQDLMDFLNPNGSDCTLVLFYTPWCRFSASLAPHFNSLPRAFPALHFLALDASQHSSLSTRFGTVAVPNILLFQGAKPMARFNHTDRTLETLKIFIYNQTGIEAKKNVVVTEDDQIGPLPSTLIKSVDWLLVFSLFFLISFIMYATIRTESIRWLIPGQEQEHAE